jgi:histidyl-tRNA synthetase
MARKKENIVQRTKGMHDILPEEYLLRKKILEKAESIAQYYGFKPIHTPYFERTEVFTTALGETSDIIEKQMYNLKTRGGDKLVVRPEGTASIVRAYLEHGMQNLPQPVMLYYDGFFFRHENPQKGRRREFQQFGVEIIGSHEAVADALVIKILFATLQELKIKPLIVHINSLGDMECRKAFRKDLASYYRRASRKICKDCERRLKVNPLRLLDCKNETCQKVKEKAPQIINYLCEECKNAFKEVLEILENAEIPYRLDHNLVRGLDYYSRTVFEVFLTEKETLNLRSLALAGGGRYDPLLQLFSGKTIGGVGGAIGIDRVLEEVIKTEKKNLREKPSPFFFIQLGKLAKDKSLAVLETLRRAKIPVSQNINKDSLKSQMKIAEKLKTPYVLIFGQKEALDNTIIVKNADTGSQETVKLNNLVDYLKKIKL